MLTAVSARSGQGNALRAPDAVEGRRACNSRATVVVGAINKAKKAEIVGNLTKKLHASTLVFGMEYQGIAVKHIESMRRKLPEGVSMMVTKNRLLRVAVDNMEEADKAKWEGLKGQKGMNAYVFAPEEEIRGAVKAFSGLLSDLKDLQPDPKKGQPEPPAPTSVKCIVLDGEVIDVAKWKTLEKIPTKEELLTQIAVGIKANPRKIAMGVKAIPSKLAYGVKALSELNEDKSMTVEAAVAAKAG